MAVTAREDSRRFYLTIPLDYSVPKTPNVYD
jgi:hypothetical protein